MADWNITQKHEPSEINGGKEYEIKDQVSLEQLNAITENSFYAMNKSDSAVSNSETSLINSQQALNNSTQALADSQEANSNSQQALNTSNQALTNSQTAVNTANQSKAESGEALSNSETALSNSQTALSNSNTAISTAESAETKSDTAISTANNAESVANGIDGKATQALETSNTASETADNALSVANSIDSKATEALNNSNSALEQVNNAVKITGDQTIAGQKTFTDDINIKSVDGNDKSILIVDNENNVLLRVRGSLSGLATVLNANSYFFRNKNNGNTGIMLNPDVAIRPETNNKLDLGTSAVMFKDLYLSGNISNGTNNVSVANLNKPNVRVAATNYNQPLYLLSVIGTSAGKKDTWQDSRFYFVPDTQTLVTPNISDGTNKISISNIITKANFVLDGTTLTITTT